MVGCGLASAWSNEHVAQTRGAHGWRGGHPGGRFGRRCGRAHVVEGLRHRVDVDLLVIKQRVVSRGPGVVSVKK